MNIIKAETFNINNFKVNPFSENNKYNENALYTLFPRYIYQNNKEDNCVFLTNPVKMNVGIQRIGKFFPTDNNCLFFWLNEDNVQGNKELFNVVLRQIDNKFNMKINTQGNKDFITKLDNKGVIVPMPKVKYYPMVRKKPTPDDNPYPQIYRTKINLDTFYDPGADNNALKKIKTTVFVPVDVAKPVKERIFKSKPEPINCLDDLRKLCCWGSTVQLTLQVNKVWVQKASQNGERMCGVSLKCLQIFVLDNPNWNKQQKRFIQNSVPQGLGIKTQNNPNKNKQYESESEESE